MSELVIATSAVSYDEPCLHLAEVHEQSPGSKGFHRYQVLIVMRGDRPAQFRRDLGAATKFKKVQPFRIPGGAVDPTTKRFHIEHTVGELIDIADELRDGNHRDVQPEPMTTESMTRKFHETKDRQRAARTGRVSVSPSLILPKR